MLLHLPGDGDFVKKIAVRRGRPLLMEERWCPLPVVNENGRMPFGMRIEWFFRLWAMPTRTYDAIIADYVFR